MFQILLKDGLIVDPAQAIHKTGSVGINDGKIAALGDDISESKAEKVYEMNGKIISPGLIDIHCNPADGVLPGACVPDDVGLNRGVTTLCDAGSAGAANFGTLRRFVIEPAKTDVFCFLHLASTGLSSLPWDEEIWDEHDFNIEYSKEIIEANRDIIKGVKIRAIQPFADSWGIEYI